MSDKRLGVLVVDLGKTRCRMQLVDPDGAVRWSADGVGTAGLATAGADALLAERIVDIAATRPHPHPVFVSAGVAGAIAAPAAAAALAGRLADAIGSGDAGCRALVTSDIVTAHLGALGGASGTALVAGTGAVAMGISPDGETTIVDGRGPELGDLGSGAWIGRAGLDAAVRARDGADTGTATSMGSALDEVLAPHGSLQQWLDAGGNLGGRLGEFAPTVIRHAELGDPIAAAIIAEAVRLLTATSLAAGTGPVSVLGGLVADEWFRHQLIPSIERAGLEPITPLGTALDGARIAAVAEHLPHERHFHRA